MLEKRELWPREQFANRTFRHRTSVPICPRHGHHSPAALATSGEFDQAFAPRSRRRRRAVPARQSNLTKMPSTSPSKWMRQRTEAARSAGARILTKRGNNAWLQPAKLLAHAVLWDEAGPANARLVTRTRTRRAALVFENPQGSAFLTYDSDHHRIAVMDAEAVYADRAGEMARRHGRRDGRRRGRGLATQVSLFWHAVPRHITGGTRPPCLGLRAGCRTSRSPYAGLEDLPGQLTSG